jgi:hypothetical protein
MHPDGLLCGEVTADEACKCILMDCSAVGSRQMEREFEAAGAEDEDDLIGPAPPELAAELEGAGDDARAQEVVRVLRRAPPAHTTR